MRKFRCKDCFHIFKSFYEICPQCGSSNLKEKEIRTAPVLSAEHNSAAASLQSSLDNSDEIYASAELEESVSDDELFAEETSEVIPEVEEEILGSDSSEDEELAETINFETGIRVTQEDEIEDFGQTFNSESFDVKEETSQTVDIQPEDKQNSDDYGGDFGQTFSSEGFEKEELAQTINLDPGGDGDQSDEDAEWGQTFMSESESDQSSVISDQSEEGEFPDQTFMGEEGISHQSPVSSDQTQSREEEAAETGEEDQEMFDQTFMPASEITDDMIPDQTFMGMQGDTGGAAAADPEDILAYKTPNTVSDGVDPGERSSSVTDVTAEGEAPFDEKTDPTSPVKSGKRVISEQGFDNYEIMDEISRGGMGVVFKARQISLNRIVAIKVMLSGADASELEVKRFIREAESCANLKHPNIVDIFDIGKHQGNFYFAMEYIEGITFDEYCKKEEVDLKEKLDKFVYVLEAMKYAHTHKIIHRDLKPVNIMITDSGIVKVMDFGLAKKLKEAEGEESLSLKTATGAVMGTPHYMSPEQANGDISDVDGRTDVFSLGVILYEMITGVRPFRGKNINEIMFSIFNNEPERPTELVKGLDWELEAIILKALEKEQEARYLTVSDMRDDLMRFIAGEPIHAKRISKLYLLKKKIRKHKVQFAVAMFFLLVILGAVAYIIDLQINPRRGTTVEVEEVTLKNRISKLDTLMNEDPETAYISYYDLNGAIETLIAENPETIVYQKMSDDLKIKQTAVHQKMRERLSVILAGVTEQVKGGKLSEAKGGIKNIKKMTADYKAVFSSEQDSEDFYREIYNAEFGLLSALTSESEKLIDTDGMRALTEIEQIAGDLDKIRGSLKGRDYESLTEQIKRARQKIAQGLLAQIKKKNEELEKKLETDDVDSLNAQFDEVTALMDLYEVKFGGDDILPLKTKLGDFSNIIRAREMFASASKFQLEGNLDEAELLLENLIKAFPGTHHSDLAVKKVALIKEFPKKIKEIREKTASCEPDSALELLAELKKTFPVYKEYADIEKNIAEVRQSMNELNAAVATLNNGDLGNDEWLEYYEKTQEKIKTLKYEPEAFGKAKEKYVALTGFGSIEELKRTKQYKKALFLLKDISDVLTDPKGRDWIKQEFELLQVEVLKPVIEDPLRGVEMVLIPAQTFIQGTESTVPQNARPAHKVTLTRPFYIDRTELTNKNYSLFFPKYKRVFDDDDLPATGVTFDDVQVYISKLSEKTGHKYRLPTEAEWECAAKGGKNLEYSTARMNIDSEKPMSFDQYYVNPYGLYHMCGNVLEFCSDWYGAYTEADRIDPAGPEHGVGRVIKGGYYKIYEKNKEEKASTYSRNAINPKACHKGVGFRCVRDVDEDVWETIQTIKKNLEAGENSATAVPENQ